MSLEPSLRIIVDGNDARVYRRGDKVTGRVILSVEQEEELKSLTLSFIGTCTTKTTRPFYATHNDADANQSRRDYEERIRLFKIDQRLLPRCTFGPTKYSWSFEFNFPELTEPKYSRWQHGPKYLKDPHPLPPSFQTLTNAPRGQAFVAYFLQARLDRTGARGAVKFHEVIPYHPKPLDLPLEPRIISRTLYAQNFKPQSDGRNAIDKAFSKLSRRSSVRNGMPRIVPTLHYPERISPGQHIPLLLSLTNIQAPSRAGNRDQRSCVLESVTVTMTTHTTLICGQPALQPEDVMVKHVTCLSKSGLSTPIPFDNPTRLTDNFRLVDDIECVPSFKTYTITRKYDLTVNVGISFEGRSFAIHSTTLLEILPRIPRELLRSLPEEDDFEVEPLPLYVPREPSKEFAPDYESLYSLSPNSSSSRISAYVGSGSPSITSRTSTPPPESDRAKDSHMLLGATEPSP